MTTSTPGSATALVTGQWAPLPVAPVAAHAGTVGAWTGTEMLVWGRPSNDIAASTDDGAAYDPTAGTWRRLPSAPLGARDEPVAAWTGTSWWIWGGHDPVSKVHAFDGATYTPETNSWLLLPPCPITEYDQVKAILVGRRVVLVAQPAGNSSQPLTAATYDVVNGTWTALAPLPLPTGYDLLWLTLGATDDTGYLWSHYRAKGYPSEPTGFVIGTCRHGRAARGRSRLGGWPRRPGGVGRAFLGMGCATSWL